MSKPKWRLRYDDVYAAEICPKCRRQTEELVTKNDGHDYVIAERCRHCGWRIDFE